MDNNEKQKLGEICEAVGLKPLRHIGTRPFQQAAGDKLVLPGEVLDGDHPYQKIRSSLLMRADFEEVKNG